LTSVNGHGQRETGCWEQGYRSIGGRRWRSCRATTSQPRPARLPTDRSECQSGYRSRCVLEPHRAVRTLQY